MTMGATKVEPDPKTLASEDDKHRRVDAPVDGEAVEIERYMESAASPPAHRPRTYTRTWRLLPPLLPADHVHMHVHGVRCLPSARRPRTKAEQSRQIESIFKAAPAYEFFKHGSHWTITPSDIHHGT